MKIFICFKAIIIIIIIKRRSIYGKRRNPDNDKYPGK